MTGPPSIVSPEYVSSSLALSGFLALCDTLAVVLTAQQKAGIYPPAVLFLFQLSFVLCFKRPTAKTSKLTKMTKQQKNMKPKKTQLFANNKYIKVLVN